MGYHQMLNYTPYGNRKSVKEKWQRVYKEIMAPNFPSEETEETKWTLRMINPKRPIPRYIIIKLSKKVKGDNLKISKRNDSCTRDPQ